MWYLFTQIWAFLGLAAAVGFLVGRMVSEARLQEEVERLRRRPAEWADPQPARVAGADPAPLTLRTDDAPAPVAAPEAGPEASPAIEESAPDEEPSSEAMPLPEEEERPTEEARETPSAADEETLEALPPVPELIAIEPEESVGESFVEPSAAEEAPEPVAESAPSPPAVVVEEETAPAAEEPEADEEPVAPEPPAEVVSVEEPQEIIVPPVVSITSALPDEEPSAPVAAPEPEAPAPEPAPPASFTPAAAPPPAPEELQPVAGGEPTMQPVPRFELDVSGGAISLPVAATSEPDDLTSVVGIGPVMESKLHALGIFTFRQIAVLNPYQLEYLAERLVVMKDRIERDNWIGQARELHYQKFGEYV